ncbi:MAG: response regulator transcription factor [Planctomycetes bacterium]|nr:response regulator transcription factor [Planctomycetota bacterium]MCW8139351.1 response regulator transcription factor [Planctomycetota bacterium]
MRILVVEDDPKIGSFLQRGLESERHTVDVARTGPEGARRGCTSAYDLVVLDLMLPGFDGHEVLRRMRDGGVNTPVIVVTARGEVADRVRGLDEGADDYLTKPFSFVELLARIRALQRRQAAAFDPVLRAGDLAVDTVKHRATFREAELDLTPREYQLLEYLMRHPGETVTRAMLADRVWGIDFDTGSNVIDVYVNYLRKKLAAAGAGSPIRTVRGAGYAFQPSSSSPAPDVPGA